MVGKPYPESSCHSLSGTRVQQRRVLQGATLALVLLAILEIGTVKVNLNSKQTKASTQI